MWRKHFNLAKFKESKYKKGDKLIWKKNIINVSLVSYRFTFAKKKGIRIIIINLKQFCFDIEYLCL